MIQGQKPPTKTPLGQNLLGQTPPPGQNPLGQNPPGQNPLDKTTPWTKKNRQNPPGKTPRQNPPYKTPRTKPPGQPRPRTNPHPSDKTVCQKENFLNVLVLLPRFNKLTRHGSTSY